MAIKGTIKVIKDDTGGSGIIKDDTGGSGGTATATATSTDTTAGSIKDDTGGSGGTATITIAEERTGREVTATTPYYRELCLNVGDLVRIDEVEYKDAGGKRQVIVTGVSRITVGSVSSIDTTGNSGVLLERDTNKRIPFYQNNLVEMKIKQGDFVRYDLVRALAGFEIAVNLREID